MNTTIRFPYLGWEFHPVKSISVFGIDISMCGLLIGIAMAAGVVVVWLLCRRTKQNFENYLDFAIAAIIFSVVGARLYYCVFNWDYYTAHPAEVITGIGSGLAIYGAIIAAVVTLLVYSRIAHTDFWEMADTACVGLVLGQAIGRWGDFFNRESFGGYSDAIWAMQLPVEEASNVTRDLLLNSYVYNGQSYIQVHPAFFYESLWDMLLFVVLLVFIKYKKFHGQVFAVYLLGYGFGRTFIELLRTDQLLIPGTSVPVSVVISVLAMMLSAGYLTWNVLYYRKSGAVDLDDAKEMQKPLHIIEEIVDEQNRRE